MTKDTKPNIEVIDPMEYMTRIHDKLAKLMTLEVNSEKLDRSRYTALSESDDLLFSTMKTMLAEAEAEVLKKKG
jgi:hypothetical protein